MALLRGPPLLYPLHVPHNICPFSQTSISIIKVEDLDLVVVCPYPRQVWPIVVADEGKEYFVPPFVVPSSTIDVVAGFSLKIFREENLSLNLIFLEHALPLWSCSMHYI